ncbi:unnamed protein product, partial [marine sediment metagenome]
MKQKYLLLTMILFVFLVSATSLSIFAATPNLQLTPDTQSVLIGNEGTVNVVVEDVTNLMAADITLNFDDTKLKYNYSAVGSFWLPEGVLVFSPLATGGSLNIQLSAEPAF